MLLGVCVVMVRVVSVCGDGESVSVCGRTFLSKKAKVGCEWVQKRGW